MAMAHVPKGLTLSSYKSGVQVNQINMIISLAIFYFFFRKREYLNKIVWLRWMSMVSSSTGKVTIGYV